MTVPLIQGTLRYAWRADPGGNNETAEGKALAELNAFAAALEPRLASCDAEAAEVVSRNAELTDVDRAVPDGFAAVKAAIESTYSCLGVTCADVGSLNHDGAQVAGMGRCLDGSSVDDEADYYDTLEFVVGNFEEECEEDDDDGWHSYRHRRLETRRMSSCDGKGQSIAWVNHEVYDIEACCDTDNAFFFLLMALFWYRPAPTRLEVIVWFAFWVFLLTWGFFKIRTIQDTNRELETYAKEKDEEDPTLVVLDKGTHDTTGDTKAEDEVEVAVLASAE
mmetsp:Transcript_9989/g.32099  ORF Transcript_9989/g.32099 Transcript_9989/m.32099 type:complete len:278 (+) Transcript_9989:197-1030(+)